MPQQATTVGLKYNAQNTGMQELTLITLPIYIYLQTPIKNIRSHCRIRRWIPLLKQGHRPTKLDNGNAVNLFCGKAGKFIKTTLT